MRFTNDECLQPILNAFRQGILPELPVNGNTQVASGVVMLGLEELTKRERVTPAILKVLLPEGMAIADKKIQLLEELKEPAAAKLRQVQLQIQSFNPGWENISALHKKYNDLVDHLEACGRLLFSNRPRANTEQGKRISSLLQQSAKWELSFYEQQQNPLAASLENAIQTPGLDAGILERFIQRQKTGAGQLRVENLHRILGGYGKETWFFDLLTADSREALVVRKQISAANIMDKGSFYLPQEYEVVKILHRENILVPEPLWLARDEAGTDAPFYVARRVGGKPMGTFMKSNEGLSEKLWLQVAEQLARIHAIPVARFSDYIDMFEGGQLHNCTARDGMRHYLDWFINYWQTFDRLSSPVEIYMFDWLYNNLPDNGRPASFIHSDFGAHNMLADGDQLTAILDWEAGLFGTPSLDLAYVKRWVTEAMAWDKFLAHYEASGGPQVDESEFVFCNAFTYARTTATTNRVAANLRYHPDREYKELILALQFLPKMMGDAYESTLAVESCRD